MSLRKIKLVGIVGVQAKQGQVTVWGVGPMAPRLEVSSRVKKHMGRMELLGVGPMALRPAAEQTGMVGVGPMALRPTSKNQRRSKAAVATQAKMIVM